MCYQTFDGDSLSLDPASPFFLDHVTRYWWAEKQVSGKRVLDCACGHGYGTYILARSAREAVGIDLNPKSLDEAKRVFQAGNLSYLKQDVLALDELVPTGKFDCIVAFEVIEHIPPETTPRFLSSIARLLSPGGVLLLSTPNHDVVLKSGVEVPDFHINNWKPKDLKAALQEYFGEVAMLGQYRARSGMGKLAFDWDPWNLRHVAARPLKHLRKRAPAASGSQAPSPHAAPRFEPLRYFSAPPDEFEGYRFSERHWRQAGLSLAVCASPF